MQNPSFPWSPMGPAGAEEAPLPPPAAAPDLLGTIDITKPFPWKIMRSFRTADSLPVVELKPADMIGEAWAMLSGRVKG